MSTSPALASNAGDRYHFVYVARRMLRLLYDRDLRLVEIEGVAAEDQHLAEDPSSFLAVDVTEYYGGETAKTAREVVVIQVKYSPTAPDQAWSLARLTGAPKAVIGKLADAYRALRVDAQRVTVRIVTNQPLDDGVRSAIEAAKNGNARRLASLAKTQPILASLKKATDFSWPLLADFLRDFDLGGFNHPSLGDEQARLSWELHQTAHGDVDMHSLVSRVQLAATPGQPASFRLADVEMHLDVRHEEMFPAPPRLDPPDRLFQTRDAGAAAKAILARPNGLLLLHGVGGIGKTSTLQLLARDHTDQAVVVIYDCYGNGEGTFVGSERFPYRKFFAQLTNQLDTILGTSILTSSRLSYDRLSTTFNRALSAAASLAAATGKRLVIAIDAADNAAFVAARSPIEKDASFIPLLPFIRWPENCVCVVTARTENLGLLGLPSAPLVVELNGFDAQETARHGRTFLPDAPDTLLSLLHARTNGNARVQARVLEDLAATQPKDLESAVIRHARDTAFAFYEAAVADRSRLEGRSDRLLLAMIAEATQPVDMLTVARLAGVEMRTIETFVQSLAFGLRREANLIRWRDQDFGDFAVSRLEDVRSEARARLADFVWTNYATDAYAERNLSRHLYAAGRLQDLLAFWLDGNRLSLRIAHAAPHTDAMAEDVRYALLAAQKLGRRKEVLGLLALAADLTQGRDVFLGEIARFPVIAAREGVVDAIVANEEENELDRAPLYVQLARGLAECGDLDAARTLYERAYAGYRASGKGMFYNQDVVELARCENAIFGLAVALQQLGLWKPMVGEGFTEAVLDFIDRGGDAKELLREVEKLPIGEQVAHAYLGVLARADVLAFDAATCDAMVEAAGTLTHDSEDLRPLDAVEALVRGRQLDAARALMSNIRRPDRPGFDANDRGLLRYMAMTEVLSGTPPALNEFFEDLAEPTADQALLLYGSLRGRARAWAGAAEAESEIREVIEAWSGKEGAPGLRLTLPYVAGEIIEAVLSLPGRHPQLVWKAVELLERAFEDPAARRYDFAAETLSRDARYRGEAEKVIRSALDALRPRDIRASVVSAVFRLYEPARRIDPELAKEVFRRARAAANAIDTTIEARAEALLDAADAATRMPGLQVADLYRIASVVEYERRKSGQNNDEHRRRILIHLAWIDAAPAFALAEAWDDAALAEIASSIPAIARGLIGQSVPWLAVSVLAEMANPDEEAVPVFEQLLEDVRDDLRPAVLRRFLAYARRQMVLQRDTLMKRLARDVSLPDEVRGEVDAYVREADEAAKSLEHTQVQSIADVSLAEDPSALDEVRRELQSSPSGALNKLRWVLTEGPGAIDSELEPLALELFEALASAQQVELLGLLADLGLSILGLFAEISRRAAPHLRETIRAAVLRLLVPENLREVSQLFRRAEFEALRVCWADDQNLYDVLAEVLGNNAGRIRADVLYRWIGRLSSLLPPDEGLPALRVLLDQMETEVPCPRDPVWRPADSALHAIVRALADLLGHPRVSDRWRAVYALVDLVVERDGYRVLPLILSELSDDCHPRWMTKREWLLFVLHHLALRHPALLAPHAETIAKSALDDFPHAVLREHAKQVVLSVAQGASVDPALLAALAKVNQPIGFIDSPPREHSYLTKTPPGFDASAIVFWYDWLARAFNATTEEVVHIAGDWIVSKWGVSPEMCEQALETDPHKYDESLVRINGLRPVETLQTYAERHGLAVAAGTLIASRPAMRGDAYDWTSWLRDHARISDPSLPARFVVPPPNRGYVYRDANRHLFVEGGEWIVIASDWNEVKATVNASVRSVLTPSKEGPAEADFLDPDWDHDRLFISELEPLVLGMPDDRRLSIKIHSWFGRDRADSRWPVHQRVFSIPAAAIQQRFGLVRRDPTKLEWWRDHEVLVRSEVWCDESRYGNDTQGTRLLMRAGALRQLMNETGCEIVIRTEMYEHAFGLASSDFRLSKAFFVS